MKFLVLSRATSMVVKNHKIWNTHPSSKINKYKYEKILLSEIKYKVYLQIHELN